MATYRYRRAFTQSTPQPVLDFLRGRCDDFLGITERAFAARPFIAGDAPTIADLSMCAYLSYPPQETGYDLSSSHPATHDWLRRIAGLPGWVAPYDLLPGKRLRNYLS